MGAFKVYLKTFDTSGAYEADFVDITRDVLKISDIKESLDSTEYDLGVFRVNGVKVSLRNDHGRFSEPPGDRSLFKSKITDSQVKITWNLRAEPLCVGFFKAGICGPLGEEIEVFRGLVSELTTKSDIENQSVDFDVLGFETLINRLAIPFDDISNGDLLSEVFYTILNQSVVTDLLTLSPSNINPDLDQSIDDKTELENKTGKEAFGSGLSLLFASQSVLTTKNQVIEIKSRDATAAVQFQFYGAGSNQGAENIIDIKNFRKGLNSVYNFWDWDETTLYAQDTSSIDTYGVLKKTIKSAVFTDTTKRQNLLTALKNDFSAPKAEMELIAPLTNATAALNLLDRVSIDYPTVYIPADENTLPLWGAAKWGSFRYPIGKFNLKIDQGTNWKIIEKKIKIGDETIEFYLREI